MPLSLGFRFVLVHIIFQHRVAEHRSLLHGGSVVQRFSEYVDKSMGGGLVI